MKKRARIISFLLTSLLLASLLCAAAFADSDWQSTNVEYGTSTCNLLDARCNSHYVQKQVGDANEAEANTCKVIQKYITEIKSLIYSNRVGNEDLTQEIDLLYNKGISAGILSWIYYSHTDVHFCDADSVITATYEYQLSRIDSKNVTDNVDLFFVGVGDVRAEVEDCYTVLFQSIYSEKIRGLLQDGDSEVVRAIISSAPSTMGSTCRYDAQNGGGEDGTNYESFFSGIRTSADEQRMRDIASDELREIFSKLYVGESFENSERLRFFRSALQTKNTAPSVNLLLSDTVCELIDALISDNEPYKNQFLTAMKNSTVATVRAANGADTVSVARISSLFAEYPLQLRRAMAKDFITSYADGMSSGNGYASAQIQRINEIVLEYTVLGGFIDKAQSIGAVDVEQARAVTRFDWYGIYVVSLATINGYRGEHSGIEQRARSLYLSTDTAVKNGGRDAGDDFSDRLSADIENMLTLVAEAEAIEFKTDHKSILEKNDVSANDMLSLGNAMNDAHRLSTRAKAHVHDTLTHLADKYKTCATANIRAKERADGVAPLRKRASDKLISLVEALSATDAQGSFCLLDVKLGADSLISKAEQVRGLLDRYVSDFLSEGFVHFSSDAEKLCVDSTDSIVYADAGSEIAIKNSALVSLDRLCALAKIYTSADGYESLDGISDVLNESKNGVSSLTDYAGIKSFASSQVARIAELIRKHEISEAKSAVSSLADTVLALLSDYDFIDGDSRSAFITRVNEIKDNILSRLDASANAEAAKSTRAEGESALSSLRIEADEKERVCCLSSVRGVLDAYCSDASRYSEANLAKLTDTVALYKEKLNAESTVSAYIRLRDEALANLDAIEDLLDEAKRIGEARLVSVYGELIKNKSLYSLSALASLDEIYSHSISEIKLFDDIANVGAVAEFVDARVALMVGVGLDRIYTSDGIVQGGEKSFPEGFDISANGYSGAIVSINGGSIPSSSVLKITDAYREDAQSVIRRAASDKLVFLADGSVAGKDVLKLLKKCAVLSSLNISLGAPLSSATSSYAVSVLLSDGVDLSDLIGVVYIREDGTVEFMEASSDGSLLEFSTDHFSEYYVVSRGSVSLLPWIICLSVILACELAVLALLLIRRRDRLKDEPLPMAMFISPLAISIKYTPRGAELAVSVLGVAVVSVGVLIAYLAACELRLRRIKETALRANRSQELESASVPMRSRAKLSSSVDGDIDEIGCGLGLCTVETAVLPPVEPMPSVSVEEANALMSDSEAKRLQSTDYFDTEIYTGAKRAEINVDTISHMFSAGDVITLNSLKEKKLVPKNVGYIKILARGRIDKPLTVVAQDFSVAAAKMIILTGGRAIPTHASEERMPRPRRKISEEF